MEKQTTGVDKSTWGPGPWQEEGDGGAWTTASGLLGCYIRHPHHGQLNGYVAVPPEHPLYGKGYDDAPDLDVHGGLTFAGRIGARAEGPFKASAPFFAEAVIDIDERFWWFGFDCGHFNDLAPGLYALVKGLSPLDPVHERLRAHETYKTVAYVTAEVESLAEQLVALK